AIWPADSRAQRRQRAATMAISVAAACSFLTLAATELDTPLSAVAGTWPMTVCGVLMLLGTALVAPRPRLTPGAAVIVLRQAVRRLAAPAIVGAGVVACVHSGVDVAGVSAPVRLALLACWWSALAAGAVQCCRIVAGLGAGVAVPPRPGRLHLGIWTLAGAGAGTAAVVFSVFVTGARHDPMSGAMGAALFVLVWAFVATVLDLRRLPQAG
ncbi:hypothetical protein ABZ297_35275, partial [Nonomuraea sp. NPDC005983]|uniref:hypothetical protein n=1 Tax=Nonomuraea sp. NPDC005983 TaxID=3155595 RepID=UPI0033AA3ACC